MSQARRVRRNRRHGVSQQTQFYHRTDTKLQVPMITLLAIVALISATIVFVARSDSVSASTSSARQQFRGSVVSSQVHTMITLGDTDLHPHQLAYDTRRNGIWFWTSEQQYGTSFSNVVYFYNIAQDKLESWPIYSGDWSSQLLAGLAVAPNGDVWIGWNFNLVDFNPTRGAYVRYQIPTSSKYPLPSDVIGDLPTNLGVADLAIGPNGTIWIARDAVLSLTAFSPASRTFTEYPLPANSGDPARLSIMSSGDIAFTTDLAANHPGYGAESIGEFEPNSGHVSVYHQPAESVAVTPSGDIFTAFGNSGAGLVRLTTAERASATAQQRAPIFQQHALPVDIADTLMVSDIHGRIWAPVANRPQIALFNPGTGKTQVYQFAAPSIAANPAVDAPYGHHTNPSSASSAVWIVPIVSMTTDGQGHLWYVRGGYNTVEEVSA